MIFSSLINLDCTFINLAYYCNKCYARDISGVVLIKVNRVGYKLSKWSAYRFQLHGKQNRNSIKENGWDIFDEKTKFFDSHFCYIINFFTPHTIASARANAGAYP